MDGEGEHAAARDAPGGPPAGIPSSLAPLTALPAPLLYPYEMAALFGRPRACVHVCSWLRAAQAAVAALRTGARPDGSCATCTARRSRAPCINMRAAGMGRGPSAWKQPALRGDEVAWVTDWFWADDASAVLETHEGLHGVADVARSARAVKRRREDARAAVDPDACDTRSGLSPVFRALAATLRQLLQGAATMDSERTDVLVQHTSIQLARYSGDGRGYYRHRDAFPAERVSDPVRVFTAIYYLNPEWTPEHAGWLRMWPPDGAAAFDVPPVGDTLLVFRSDVEHEVLPARAERWAVTMWLYGRPQATPSTPDGSLVSFASVPTTSSSSGGVVADAGTARMQQLVMDASPAALDLIKAYLAASSPSTVPKGPSVPAAPWRMPADVLTASSIFISVPSYRDPQLLGTLASALEHARFADRISFGICLQLNTVQDPHGAPHAICQDDLHAFLPDWPAFADRWRDALPRIRFLLLDATAAAGPMWARHLAFSLHREEDYVLCVDSHMLFVPDWDVKLLAQHEMARQGDKDGRVLLSAYPPDFPSKGSDAREPVPPTSMHVRTDLPVGPEGMPRFAAATQGLPPPTTVESELPGGTPLTFITFAPLPASLIAAGFMFVRAAVYRSILAPDPACRHVFFGEETLLCMSAAVHGICMYHPGESLVFHQWARASSGRASFREHAHASFRGRAWRQADAVRGADALQSRLRALALQPPVQQWAQRVGLQAWLDALRPTPVSQATILS